MKNINQLIFIIKDLKNEFTEACEKGVGLTGKEKERNEKYRNNIVNEMLRLESVIKELDKAKHKKETNINDVEVKFDIVEEDKPLRQDVIVTTFRTTMVNVINKYASSSEKVISEGQRATILSGLNQRIGLDVDQVIMGFVNKFNFEQASNLIKILKGISYYNQRVQATKGIKTLSHKENYEEILLEACNNIHKKEWFDHNKELFAVLNELESPTEAQVRRIANVAQYPETAVALQGFGLDVRDYEVRALSASGDIQPFYTMNWKLFKKDIETKINRESASNFIQTYDYISNFYEGRKLESHQRGHLRSLYIQLADYDRTRPSYLNTILKDKYNVVSAKLEEAVRLEKVVRNDATSRLREEGLFIKAKKSVPRETRSTILKAEQEEAKELTSFLFNIYAEVGQDVPEEARNILPYFIQSGESKYATVEEVHYKELRKLVFEQRDVIKSIYGKYGSTESTHFNWATFICGQPLHILRALGLDIMM